MLDVRISQELREMYAKWLSEGKVRSQEQLATYYATFRSKFGPDKLRNLDGVALLETMHSHGTKDSLVYWLEFKDDDEFPTMLFGSIAGGSSFKFKLFNKRETGLWTTGTPAIPITLSLEEAIVTARKHRDQLIAGAELLEAFPIHATADQYLALQKQMDTIAPDVSDSAWGHKYFSLLYPDKLDSYHNFEYQCFHLIKLLQQLPSDVRRYSLAEHYVTLSDNLQIPLNHLTTLLNERNGSPYTYWRIGTNAGGGKPGEYWPMMREGQLCAIGWAKLGDLTTIVSSKEGKEKIRYALQDKYPDMSAPVAGKGAQQIFNFIHSIALGDLILASEGAKILGIGKVTGPYTYEPSANFPHQRSVEWLSLKQWKQPNIEGLLTTVWKMRKEQNFVEAEQQVLDVIDETAGHPGPIPPSLTGIPSRIQTALERKGQVILYGPPGTGKTYWAEDAACELAARSRFNLSFNQLSVEQKALIKGRGNTTNGNVRLCSFHPAYGYEDFLEGFRPTSQNGNMQFVPREGIFKKLCEDAQKVPNQKFYLIIDEINRGDIPRIFGELLTVIEMDKRGKPVVLPLTGQSFSVPKNVYVIGTMNTADRSIALLDTALRRRFGFIELMPDTTPLNMAMARGIPLGPWLEDLNRRICESIGQDARNRQIGHAYFLQNGQPISDFTLFARVIQEDIIPLLEEYCYEDYTKLASILGKQLVDSQNQKIRHELFDTSRQDKLLDALLEPCSIITTSIVAANAEIAKKLLEQDNQTIDQEIAGASSSEVVESHS